MNKDLEEYERSIKRKHKFGWTPKYEETANTSVKEREFTPVALKTIEKLGWELLYEDNTSVVARRNNTFEHATESISVTFSFGKIKVHSSSLGNEFWDFGRNSKRVKLFIYAFKQTANEIDRTELEELATNYEKVNNWDDYELPTELPPPKTRKQPQFWIPVVGSIVLAGVISLLLAAISHKFYLIGLFELGVGIAIGSVYRLLIKASNYTNYQRLHILMIAMIVVIYFLNQYFQYMILVPPSDFNPINFFEFMEIRMGEGLQIKSLNVGWIGLVVVWIFQVWFTWLLANAKLTSSLIEYSMTSLPKEVVDFAYYHFLKTEDECFVRTELAKMGWTDKQDQDEVFEAIAAHVNVNQWFREG